MYNWCKTKRICNLCSFFFVKGSIECHKRQTIKATFTFEKKNGCSYDYVHWLHSNIFQLLWNVDLSGRMRNFQEKKGFNCYHCNLFAEKVVAKSFSNTFIASKQKKSNPQVTSKNLYVLPVWFTFEKKRRNAQIT